MQNSEKSLLNFFISEWLFSLSLILFIITSIILKRFPSYTTNELEVLFILFILFVTVNGIQQHGLSYFISKILRNNNYLTVKLITITFFLSAIVTNDIALLLIIPFTLQLNTKNKDIIVILETLSANVGSAFTPIGNPQNLYIYWTYKLNLSQFLSIMIPFSFFFLFILIMFSFFLKNDIAQTYKKNLSVNKKLFWYIANMILIILLILHILPIYMGLITLIYPLAEDRKQIKIDYFLIIIFFLFFGIADNLAFAIQKQLNDHINIFLASTLTSQIISNVPTTTIFTNFTTDWKTLLWGVNAGGFGNFIASLANLIAFRLYTKSLDTKETISFTYKFFIIGYLFLIIAFFTYYFAHTYIL